MVKSLSIAYRWAFDLCASWAYHAQAPIAVMASLPDSQQELLERLDGRGFLIPITKSNFKSREPDRDQSLDKNLTGCITTRLPGDCSLVILIEPEANAGRRVFLLPEIVRTAREVIAVTANGTRRFLPEWQGREASHDRNPIPAIHIRSLLESEGFRVRLCVGMPGLASLAFGFAAGFATRVNRRDAADRFYARMRQTLLTRGRLAEYTPLSAMVFQKAG